MTDRELGRAGSYVLFENDVVKVWQNDLAPGEASEWHHHDHNYLFVATSPGNLKVEFEDGSSHENVMPFGKVTMGEKDSTHQLSNTGTEPYSSVIIEIK